MLSTPAKLVSGFLLISSFLLGGCAVPAVMLFDDGDSGVDLAPGEASNVHFFTATPNLDTGISLNAGETYQLDITILSNWVDSTIEENERGEPLDETGFANSLMPFEALGVARRSRDHRWFELMLYQPNCGRQSLRGISDMDFDESGEAYSFVATCDGNLRMYVNDSPGYYFNNTGYANILVSRTN